MPEVSWRESGAKSEPLVDIGNRPAQDAAHRGSRVRSIGFEVTLGYAAKCSKPAEKSLNPAPAREEMPDTLTVVVIPFAS